MQNSHLRTIFQINRRGIKAAAAIFAVILSAAALCGCSPTAKENPVPERITLYIEQESRIVTLDYADYLTGCIFACADPSFQREALLAAGIACSGQAVYRMKNEDHSRWFGADLTADPEFAPEWLSPEQLELEYGEDYEKYREKISEIARQAADILPEYEGEPANTLLCRVSSGITDDGGLPYLPPLKLSSDKESPFYSCSSALTEEIVRRSISEAVGGVSLPSDREQWFTDPEETPAGTLIKISFGGKELSGEQLRRALELRSANIGIEYSYGTFTFSTLGDGGNVGMSVWTAEKLALGGSTAEEILCQFYPEVELAYYGK